MLIASSEDSPILQHLGLSSHPNISVATYQAPFPADVFREVARQSRLKPGLQSAIDCIAVVQRYTDTALKDPGLLQKVEAFKADLLVGDVAVSTSFALADKLGIPKGVLFVAGLMPPIDSDYYGLGANSLAHVPQFNTLFSSTMTFWQRVHNVITAAFTVLLSRLAVGPSLSKSWTDYDIAPHDMYISLRNLALVIATDDFAVTSARPVSPHVKVVGPLTAVPAKPMPAELEEYLQSAGDAGVVYASFGTTAIPEPHELEAICAALSALAPMKAIWKLSKTDQDMLRTHGIRPKINVKVMEWVPQNDLLGHPAMKAFLTQGGTNSLLEAMYHGVPIAGLPLCCEQGDNIAEAQHRGAAIAVCVHDRANLAANLESALRTLVTDPSYKQAAAVVSQRMQAHRRRPAEIAADWEEHVAWTHGSTYLRSAMNSAALVQAFQADLLINDVGTPTGFALADKLGIPKAILVVVGLILPLDSDWYGLGANNLARVPQLNTLFSPAMAFWERVQNVVACAAHILTSRAVIAPSHSKSWTEHGIAPYKMHASLRNLSLVIVTDDFALTSARPVSPHVKVVGPLTAVPAKPLPVELEEYMQSAGEDGVVYASFGTTAIPEPYELEALSTALSALAPAKAIWKLSKADQKILHQHEIQPGANVKVLEWLPQQDLLAHSKLKAFLTQGGCNSVLEAMYHGTPIVGLAMCCEQGDNIAKAQYLGAAIAVRLHDRKNLAANLERALRKVAGDPAFKIAAGVISQRMQAHRRRPAELAADWVEHVAWTHGSTYLRSAMNPLPWYQEYLLNVLALLHLCRSEIVTPWVKFLLSLMSDELLRRVKAKPMNEHPLAAFPVVSRVMVLQCTDLAKADVVSASVEQRAHSTIARLKVFY
ncbi:hypothetical protein WJX72_011715 [[Myrmecia] bisecta]|uniref:Uncharacterized protein n=1 Tax=[Myrmecia] bisecta TaxID=41462 RepID=A0AAW1PA55_9CHLO